MDLPVAPELNTAQPHAAFPEGAEPEARGWGPRGECELSAVLADTRKWGGRGWAGMFMPSLEPASLVRRRRGREGAGGVLQRSSSTWKQGSGPCNQHRFVHSSLQGYIHRLWGSWVVFQVTLPPGGLRCTVFQLLLLQNKPLRDCWQETTILLGPWVWCQGFGQGRGAGLSLPHDFWGLCWISEIPGRVGGLNDCRLLHSRACLESVRGRLEGWAQPDGRLEPPVCGLWPECGLCLPQHVAVFSERASLEEASGESGVWGESCCASHAVTFCQMVLVTASRH